MKVQSAKMINVIQTIKTDRAITLDTGILLRNKIMEYLINDKDIIILDFYNVKLFTTIFFNSSIGYLIQQFGSDSIKTRIKLKNISELGNQVYTDCFKNAELKVNNPQSLQDQIENILQNYSK